MSEGGVSARESGAFDGGGGRGIAGAKPLHRSEGWKSRARWSVRVKSREDRISGGDGGGPIQSMMREEEISLLIAAVFLSDKEWIVSWEQGSEERGSQEVALAWEWSSVDAGPRLQGPKAKRTVIHGPLRARCPRKGAWQDRTQWSPEPSLLTHPGA